MPATIMGEEHRDPMKQARRRAKITAAVAALVAVGFYVAFMIFSHWTHKP